MENSYESWVEYTIDKKPIQVMDIVEDYGYPKAYSKEELTEIVYDFLEEVPGAIKILKKAHPDYRLFFPYNPKLSVIKNDIEENKQEKNIGAEKILTVSDTDKEFLKKAITIGIVIIGVVQILKLIPNARN